MTIHLFCLPPAGSSTALFSGWNSLTGDDIKVVPIEYPGHGMLVKQPLTDCPQALTQYIVDKIQTYELHPFVLFGHSVGAALAWRVEHKIRQTSLSKQLKLLVISGRPELTYTSKMAPKGGLSRSGLVTALNHYNAVPKELLENDDALDFFLTLLCNDFCLNDNMLQDTIVKTDTPLMAFFGENDPDIAGREQMDAWQQHSSQWLGSYPLAGDHFFFNQPASRQAMLDKICNAVAEQHQVSRQDIAK